MWPAIISLLGQLFGGGQQQQQDPMAGFASRMRQGMGQTPQYPGQQIPGAGLNSAGQPGSMFNQGFGVDRERWEQAQALARRMNGGGAGGGGF